MSRLSYPTLPTSTTSDTPEARERLSAARRASLVRFVDSMFPDGYPPDDEVWSEWGQQPFRCLPSYTYDDESGEYNTPPTREERQANTRLVLLRHVLRTNDLCYAMSLTRTR